MSISRRSRREELDRYFFSNGGNEEGPESDDRSAGKHKPSLKKALTFKILLLAMVSLAMLVHTVQSLLSTNKFALQRRANELSLTLSSNEMILSSAATKSVLLSAGDRNGAVLSSVGTKEVELLSPKVVLLASWPNSGTSYTIMMTRRATRLATATNSGKEVFIEGEDSIPLYENHPEGPFWWGPSVRKLPSTNIMTKTHCAKNKGRLGVNATAFLRGCLSTYGYTTTNGTAGHKYVSILDRALIAKVIHLIRNPYHNVVARFHLGSRIDARDDPQLKNRYPKNSTGFRQWCYDVEQEREKEDRSIVSKDIWKMMRRVPCHREFYLYIQWHNNLNEITSSDEMLFDKKKSSDRIMLLHYEDYATKHNDTANAVLNFLEQKAIELPFLKFRPLPSYEDHFTAQQRADAKDLMQALATPATWDLIKHYFEQEVVKKVE